MRVATREDPDVLGVPGVVGVTDVRIEPAIVVIALDVEHVQVAVGIHSCATSHP